MHRKMFGTRQVEGEENSPTVLYQHTAAGSVPALNWSGSRYFWTVPTLLTGFPRRFGTFARVIICTNIKYLNSPSNPSRRSRHTNDTVSLASTNSKHTPRTTQNVQETGSRARASTSRASKLYSKLLSSFTVPKNRFLTNTDKSLLSSKRVYQTLTSIPRSATRYM